MKTLSETHKDLNPKLKVDSKYNSHENAQYPTTVLATPTNQKYSIYPCTYANQYNNLYEILTRLAPQLNIVDY